MRIRLNFAAKERLLKANSKVDFPSREPEV